MTSSARRASREAVVLRQVLEVLVACRDSAASQAASQEAEAEAEGGHKPSHSPAGDQAEASQLQIPT